MLILIPAMKIKIKTASFKMNRQEHFTEWRVTTTESSKIRIGEILDKNEMQSNDAIPKDYRRLQKYKLF